MVRFAEIKDWLIDEGRLTPDFSETLQQLVEKLLAAGVPLLRFFLGVRAVHPQIAAIAYIWSRDEPHITEGTRDHSVLQSGAFRNSPLYNIYEKGETFIRRRIGVEAALAPFGAPSAAERDSVLEFPILDDLRKIGGTDYMVFALPQSSGTKASLSLSTYRKEGFHDDEVEGIRSLISTIALITETHEVQRTATTLLETYLGKHPGRRVLGGDVQRGEGITIAAAIWYCDLRGFSAMSTLLPRHEVIAALNDYFEAMGRPVEEHGGEILKFIGDAMLAIFPMQDDLDRDRACRSALEAALEGLANLRDLNDLRASNGKARLRAGIGLHAGTVTYGNIGTSARLDFTVIGPAVNLACRLEGMCRPLGENLLASKAFASPCGFKLVPLGTYELAGIPEKQEIYGLPR
ncbi:MAG TPA: adenylate/guanylate cyclase domain-containing protein [Dongiaceae bacterium]|jgi:adenylate cyclase|nr:adenylate/guanylate cyclase domain-containing protein [Dongiaceae bacterium]